MVGCNMTALPPLQLSRLRDIGFFIWDPIGIMFREKTWVNQRFADEYDSYMLQAASNLCRDIWTVEEAAQFLLGIECGHIGMDEQRDSATRALATAKAIKAYVDGLVS